MNRLQMNEKRDKKRIVQLGKHIRRIRKSAGISLDELAARCDVDKSKISQIENGKKDYTITTLLELARGLGKHPKKLLDEDFDFLKDWE
ncbi:MAG: helix-turn-helix transcriptional regulator [Bacteroidota bacterium]|nr:helix-turn-helix transcriptional regulator [Bacteroidota bacterium]